MSQLAQRRSVSLGENCGGKQKLSLNLLRALRLESEMCALIQALDGFLLIRQSMEFV